MAVQLCNLFDYFEFDKDNGAHIVAGLSADSRTIKKGYVFAAIAGDKADGHDYIDQAINNGAIAIIGEKQLSSPISCPYIQIENARLALAKACARFWPKRPSIHAAITGTNGKTSIAEFLRQIWQSASWDAASCGTLGVRTPISGLSLDAPSLTTLGPDHLFPVIQELAKSGIRCLALEASSHGLTQDRLSALDIHVAGFSNLSRDHLDYHGDMDSYFAAKARLFTQLLPDGAAAAINIDDEYGRRLLALIKDRPLVIKTIGHDETADLQIINLGLTDFGYDCHLRYDGQDYHFPVALQGHFQVENALLASLMAHLSGLPVQDSLGALPRLKPIAGRMQPVAGHPQGAKILVDYAHTPDALENALSQLKSDIAGKLVVLFGCGGDRDTGKRALMGAVARKLADAVYVTDDNPRSEDPAQIRKQIMDGHSKAFIEIGDRKQAIQSAVASLGAGDILLIAGKGHETTQMIGHETLPFDDVAIAKAALTFLPEEANQ